MPFLDISDELKVSRFGNGIKLIKPQCAKMLGDTGHTVNNILQLPFPVYFDNAEHVSIKSNEQTAKACGFASLKDFIGKPVFEYFKKETIIEKIANHKRVMNNNATLIAEESAVLQDGNTVNTLSVRMPWYGDENNIIGLFGCSIWLGKNPLAESLFQIAKLGLLNQEQLQDHDNFLGKEIDSVYFTRRELDCLRLTIRGKPAKQVAYELGISQRTVEEYLDNIKIKMKVSSKAALIEKGIRFLSP